MKLSSLAALAALASACTTTDTSTQAAALATENLDTAPACAGILTYVNWASYSELAYYLPNSLANAIVARRNLTPFVSMADLSSVSGVAQGRLEQIAGRARTVDFIDAECAGVFEEHAVSYDEQVAILAFVNGASASALRNATPHNLDVVPYLIATRPYASLAALAATPQVGIATFHALKVAAVDGPFEVLVAAVNAAAQDVTISTNFDWFALLYSQDQPGWITHLECWGLDDLVTELGGTIRNELADADEVTDDVTGAVSYADRFGGVALDPTAGLADLATWAAGRTFYGCYATYAPDPWSGVVRRFYLDQATDTGVLIETRWSE